MSAGRTKALAGILVSGLLVLAGCTGETAPPEPMPPPPAEEDCGAAQLGAYIGQPASEDVLARIRGWRGDKPIRVLRPGWVVTMDYVPARLNVFLDEQGRITEFKCN